MFRAMFSPTIRSIWLYEYLKYLVSWSLNYSSDWCHGWVGTTVLTGVMDELELQFWLVSWMSWNYSFDWCHGWVGTTVLTGVMDELELQFWLVSWMSWNYSSDWCHGWVGTTVRTHPWHQSAATLVNITRYCKYSQVSLMMGENISRNM